MKKLSTLFIAFAVVASGGLAHAQGAQVSTAKGYGMAGCGLGSMLFGSDPGFIQVVAATTNGSFGSQTFGITSGTSNCKDSANPVVQVSSFVETNREILAKDIARGSGETLSALSSLAECSNAASVGRTLQQNFGVIFPSAGMSDTDVSQRVIQVLRNDAALSCRVLG